MTCRILIVDDDASSRLLLSEFLDDAGFVVVAAGDCAAAKAAAAERPFDLAILDMNLPDGTGADLLASLREQCPALAAFLLTGEDEMDARQKCGDQAASFAGFITKPFSLMGILDKIRSVTT